MYQILLNTVEEIEIFLQDFTEEMSRMSEANLESSNTEYNKWVNRELVIKGVPY